MVALDKTFVDKIVQTCFDVYNKLPKTGKPVDNEWTVLSCFIKYDRSDESIEVVSLGTGSKCIGASKMSPKGVMLNDSHAEVIARRGFMVYIYENLQRALKNETSIYKKESDHFKLDSNIDLLFYSSQLPCGDASIVPKNGEEEQFGDILKQQKRTNDSDINEPENKKQRLENDIHRTGAKCLPQCEQDSKELGVDYHLLGQVRTKPGRGDRTLSVSCSDKISKWIHLGVQGGLIDILCGPIFIKYIIIGGGVPYSEESLYRALLKRNTESLPLDVTPEFYQSSLVFMNIKGEDRVRSTSASIVWVQSNNQILDVAVQGKKLGLTKKTSILPRKSLCISKYNLYTRFLNIVNSVPHFRTMLCDEDNIEIPYNVMKSKSTDYKMRWETVKNQFFKSWTVKPDMWDFCVDVN